MTINDQSLSVLIDRHREMRVKRLDLEREAKKLLREETELKSELIAVLRGPTPGEEDWSHYDGALGGVELQCKTKPSVNDWDLLHKYILDNEAPELLHKRLTESAVQERWDAGVEVPGVEEVVIWDLKLTQVK